MDRRQQVATDHKTRTDDEHIHEEDKQQLESNPHDEQPMIPKVGTNPELRELIEKNAGKPSPGDEDA